MKHPEAAARHEWRSYYFYGILLVLLTTIPIVWLVRGQLAEYRQARNAEWAFALLEDAFLAYEAVSVERGPTNSALGATTGADYRWRHERLVATRRETDLRIEALMKGLFAADCDRCPAMLADLERIRGDLARGRAAFDALLADEARQEKSGAIRAATDGMIRATHPFGPMLNDIVHLVSTFDPAELDEVMLARLAADFREYAGRLGSFFTEALVRGRNLSESEQHDAAIIEGRVYQLRDVLLVRVTSAGTNPHLRAAVERLKREYLDTSLQVAIDLEGLLNSDGEASMTPAQFADLYVPGMQAIVALRDVVFHQAKESARSRLEEVWRSTIVVISLCVVTELLMFWVIVRFRGRYVERLAQLTSLISQLQAERPIDYGREAVLSELTHDMKSPQAGIIALLELARSTQAYQSNPELFFRIEGYARRTLKMVDDFVQLSQTRSPAMVSADVDLLGVLLDATDSLDALARSRQIEVKVVQPDSEPFTVYGQAELLVRAITNVVENAIKYSPDGAHVTCELKREHRWIALSIADTGYGIREADIPYVFDRYRRFHAPEQPRVPGTGLGLAFVKEVVVQMRGKVVCHSTLGVGTEFVLRFPRRRSWIERIRESLQRHWSRQP